MIASQRNYKIRLWPVLHSRYFLERNQSSESRHLNSNMGNTTSRENAAKLEYLGRGVDCRTPRDTWLSILDACDGNNIVPHDRKNVKVTPVAAKHSDGVDKTSQCTKSGGCSLSIKPHECAKLVGELTVNRSTNTSTKHQNKLIITKTATMTNINPDILGKDRGVHRTEYERWLCEFILKHIGEMQKEQNEPTDHTDLGKRISSLKARNPVGKLEEYLSEAKESKEASSHKQVWQTVADACSSFLDETRCTHYVSSIVLGAEWCESTETETRSTSIAGEAGGSAVEITNPSLHAQYQSNREENTFMTDERGVVDKKTDSVATEEVIEAKLTPVFQLIKKKELHLLMKALLHCYDQSYQGALLGPFNISCREVLHKGEQEIYWQAINNKEIYGTTKAEEASTFYIKHASKRFQIVYKTETKKTECYVLPDVSDGNPPLKLVTSTYSRKISFVLKNNVNISVDIPQTTASWKRESPVFIQRPKIRSKLGRKGQCYLHVKKQEYDKPSTSKYTVVASDKPEMDNSLFYFTPVTEANHHLPVSVQLRTQSDYSQVEDELSRQSADSTLSAAGPPPPPIQQPESGSTPVSDLSSELKDFFELVGEDYIFPLQVKTEGSDTQ